MSAAPSAGQFKSLAAAQQPGLMLYNYSADEIGHCTNIYPTIQQWAQNMHQAGIKNLITMSPNPALYSDGSGSGRSAVDIWVLLPLMYNNSKSEVNRVLQKGDSVWSYNTLGRVPIGMGQTSRWVQAGMRMHSSRSQIPRRASLFPERL